MDDLKERFVLLRDDLSRQRVPDLHPGMLAHNGLAEEPPEDDRHRRPLLAAVILIVTLVVVGSSLYGLGLLGDNESAIAPGPGEIVRYRFDSPPQPIAVGEGAAWVNVGGEGSHLRSIDVDTGEQRSTDVPGGDWPAVGGGSVWFTCNSACGGGTILQIDPDTAAVVDRFASGGGASQITGAPDGVWFTAETGVSFISSEGEIRTISDTRFNLIGIDGQNLWVSADGGITRLDTQTGEVLARVPFGDVCTMEVAHGMVWIASCMGGPFPGADADRLMGIDGSTGDVLFDRAIEGYGQMRFADGVLWLAQNDPTNENQIRILRFDPRTGEDLGDPIALPHGEDAGFATPGISGPHVFFATGEDSLWVTDFGSGEVIRVGMPVTPDTSSSTEPTQPSGSFGFAPTTGWHDAATDSEIPEESGAIAWAANRPFVPGDLSFAKADGTVLGIYTEPSKTIEELAPDQAAIVVVATLGTDDIYPADPSVTFEAADSLALPGDPTFETSWEGHGESNISRVMSWVTVDGWLVDVRAYFGTHEPSADLVASVNQQLEVFTLPTPSNALSASEWQVVELDGQPVPLVARPLTLRFEATRLEGRTACNGFSAPYSVDGLSLDVGTITGTLVGCPGVAGATEDSFMRALVTAQGFERGVAGLMIKSKSGTVLLEPLAGGLLAGHPCSLLTREQVAAATGSEVLDVGMVPGSQMIVSSPGQNPCNYETDGPFGSIVVYVDQYGRDRFETRRDQDPVNTELIDGLGDEAFAVGKAAIWVRIGDGYFVIGTQLGAGDEGVQVLSELARDALEAQG